jgi:hypothetical protein
MADEYGLSYDPGASARSPALTDDGLPTRPYASPDQVPAGAEFRSNAFRTGVLSDPGSAASSLNQDPGLTLNSQQFNAQVPAGVRSSSVLTPIMRNPGGLGMSAGDAARRLPDGTYMGSVIGTSQSSFEPAVMRRIMTGQDTGIE